jgi:hypothetical protein
MTGEFSIKSMLESRRQRRHSFFFHFKRSSVAEAKRQCHFFFKKVFVAINVTFQFKMSVFNRRASGVNLQQLVTTIPMRLKAADQAERDKFEWNQVMTWATNTTLPVQSDRF